MLRGKTGMCPDYELEDLKPLERKAWWNTYRASEQSQEKY